MPEIQLVRQEPVEVSEEDKAVVRRVLFGIVNGLGEANRKSWNRFINGVMRLGYGEIVTIITHRERLGNYHRRHMKFEATLFEAQERFDNWEQFRNWLKIGAGHCDWMPGPKGAVVPVPRSISYGKLDQDGMQEFHENLVQFLRTDRALKVLWPHLKFEASSRMMERIVEDPFAKDYRAA